MSGFPTCTIMLKYDMIKLDALKEFVAYLESGEDDYSHKDKLIKRIKLQIQWLEGKVSYEEAKLVDEQPLLLASDVTVTCRSYKTNSVVRLHPSQPS